MSKMLSSSREQVEIIRDVFENLHPEVTYQFVVKLFTEVVIVFFFWIMKKDQRIFKYLFKASTF